MSGNPPNLLADTQYSKNPWPGYSITAGLNYDLGQQTVPVNNRPALTGIIPTGGIPALDQGVRAEAYQNGGPTQANAQAVNGLQAQAIPPETYNGHYGDRITSPVKQAMGDVPPPTAEPGGQNSTNGAGQNPPGSDLGILSTPTSP